MSFNINNIDRTKLYKLTGISNYASAIKRKSTVRLNMNSETIWISKQCTLQQKL